MNVPILISSDDEQPAELAPVFTGRVPLAIESVYARVGSSHRPCAGISRISMQLVAPSMVRVQAQIPASSMRGT